LLLRDKSYAIHTRLRVNSLNMAICFVIQPFDHGEFDKRYEDVFVPAIKAAELEPYRVDRDPSASIPIDEIEAGIRRSDACLADISTSNPNVWFELGYAIAASKPVVLVCKNAPDRRFPFDIQHRTVIIYETESARDFEELEKKITARLQAELLKEDRLEKLSDSSIIANIKGLSQMEIVALVTIAENAVSPEDFVSVWSIRQDMERSGYTKIAVTLAVTSLLKKGFVLTQRDMDQNGNEYSVYQVDSRGMQWLIDNQNSLVLKRERSSEAKILDEDIPF
jgi:hypothetical protein